MWRCSGHGRAPAPRAAGRRGCFERTAAFALCQTSLQQVRNAWSCESMDNISVPPPPSLASSPSLAYRTPGYHRWTSSETRGSVASGLSTKRRTYRCRHLRYLFGLQLFPWGHVGLSKAADTPPLLIFGMSMEIMMPERGCWKQNNEHYSKCSCMFVVLLWYWSQVSCQKRHHALQHFPGCPSHVNPSPPPSRSMSVTSARCPRRRWRSRGSTTTFGKDFLPTCAKNLENSSTWRSCTIRRTKSTWGSPK